jgi:uncharacterized membrane-anchored protein YitT (DUF2179 family)
MKLKGIKLNRKELLDILFRLMIVIFSNLLLSVATVWFLEPADLYSGGATGTAQLVQRFFKLFDLNVNLGLLIFLVNIPIVLIGFKYVSKKFAIYSIVAVMVQSLGVAFIKGSPFQELINPILTSTENGSVQTLNYGGILTLAICGGLLGGAASGIALRYGTSTGGIDVAAQAFALKQNVSIGNFTMIFNVALAIIGGGLLQGSWIIAVFTCIRMILNSLVTDKIHTAYTYTSLHIFTTHSLEISAEIMKELQRGCTFYDVEGAYSHIHSKEVYCVVSRWEAEKAIKIVRKYDPKAFISMAPVKRVNGNFKRKSII